MVVVSRSVRSVMNISVLVGKTTYIVAAGVGHAPLERGCGNRGKSIIGSVNEI